MKTLRPLFAFAIIATFLASCSTSNDVVGGIFQKRKYTKGIYWNQRGVKKSAEAEKESDVAVAGQNEEIRLEKNAVRSVGTSEKTLAASAVVTHEEMPAVETKSSSVEKTSERGTQAESNSKAVSAGTSNKTVIREKKGKTIPQLLNKKQKSQSGADSDAMFILAVIFAILIPPLGVLIYTNIDWVKVLICLLLTILFFLPGMIYALLVVFDVI